MQVKRSLYIVHPGYRRLLNTSYKDHVTNKGVHRKIHAAIGEYGELLTMVKKTKIDSMF